MKQIILTLLCVVTLLIGCTNANSYNTPTQQMVYQPSVAFGYVGNTYMAHITDARGEQYMMPYNLFTQLFNQGGYNAVDQYYWSNPNDSRFTPYNVAVFHISNTADAVTYHNSFATSYHTVYITHHVYTPSNTVISRTVIIHHHNSVGYQPSNATPVVQHVVVYSRQPTTHVTHVTVVHQQSRPAPVQHLSLVKHR